MPSCNSKTSVQAASPGKHARISESSAIPFFSAICRIARVVSKLHDLLTYYLERPPMGSNAAPGTPTASAELAPVFALLALLEEQRCVSWPLL